MKDRIQLLLTRKKCIKFNLSFKISIYKKLSIYLNFINLFIFTTIANQ